MTAQLSGHRGIGNTCLEEIFHPVGDFLVRFWFSKVQNNFFADLLWRGRRGGRLLPTDAGDERRSLDSKLAAEEVTLPTGLLDLLNHDLATHELTQSMRCCLSAMAEEDMDIP